MPIAWPDPVGASHVRRLAAIQRQVYELQPAALIADFNREQSARNSYRGRQVLELLQNADDACDRYDGEARLLFLLRDNYLVVANTGHSFSVDGLQSLVISDKSPKRLHRSQQIGNKGLGFRSILSWTDSPLLLSGPYLVEFSSHHAQDAARELATGIPGLEAELGAWEATEGFSPVPILRFPYVADPGSPAAMLASGFRERGYSTVIVLPLRRSRDQTLVHDDVLAQVRTLRSEVLIFCRHLMHLTVEADGHSHTWTVERRMQGDHQTVVLSGNGRRTVWHVHTRQGRIPQELLDDESRGTPGYEIAVALPDSEVDAERHALNVYFPTHDSLPMACLVHATLATDDGRKRIIESEANRFVLRQAAEILAELAEIESTHARPCRGLALLAGAERCDPELKELGFLDALLTACRARRLFPLVNGELAKAEDARRPPDRVWTEIVGAGVLPEMLAVAKDSREMAFTDTVGVSWFDDSTLAARLEAWFRTLPARQAGVAFAKLMATDQLPRRPAALLLDDACQPIPTSHTVLLGGGPLAHVVPNWARDLSFLNQDFAAAIREELASPSIRALRYRLEAAGYGVQEYQLEALARHIAARADRETAKTPEASVAVWQAVLRVLWSLNDQEADSSGLARVPLKVITSAGRTRRATETYLGPDYPSGALVHALYAPLHEDEFVAGPASLGLSGKPAEIERFLTLLGVASEPRVRTVSDRDLGPAASDRFVEDIIQGLPYPNRLFGFEIRSPEETRRHFWLIRVRGLSVPDRLLQLLERSDPEDLIAFFATSGSCHLSTEHADGAMLEAMTGNQRTPRTYAAVQVPNPVLYLLRRSTWVRSQDGNTRRPEEIVLTRVGGRVFEGLLFNHGLDGDHPRLRVLGGRRIIDGTLVRLGAISSLESLRPDDLYAQLLALPERDPRGEFAPVVYRTILDNGLADSRSELRDRFVREGRMWGQVGDEKGYFPVAQLRYLARGRASYLAHLRIPLVSIEARRNSTDIERLFGVKPLRSEEVRLDVDQALTEYAPWSEIVQRHVARAMPFLYAFRLSSVADEAGREGRLLARSEIWICDRVGLRVALREDGLEHVLIEDEGQGVVVGNRSLFMVARSVDAPTTDPVFWRAVGDLYAELLERNVGADFAALLVCSTANQMRRLLDRLTGGRADELLVRATRFLETPEEEEPPISFGRPFADSSPAQSTKTGTAALDAATFDDTVNGGSAVESDPPSGYSTGKFVQKAPPGEARRTPSPLIIVRTASASDRTARNVLQLDEGLSLSLAEAFETSQGRFPIRVDHIRGMDSLGCDLVSVTSEATLREALDLGRLEVSRIDRFIEVKARSDRTGAVELSEAQAAAAEGFGPRYFLYRVFRTPTEPGKLEIAVLRDPMNSSGLRIKTLKMFVLSEGSGAEWFELVRSPDGEAPST